MTTAPQRPGFVLVWIGAFTLLVALAFGYLSPADIGDSEAHDGELTQEVLPATPSGTQTGPFHYFEKESPGDPGAERAESDPVSVAYADHGELRTLELHGSVQDANAEPCANAEVQLVLRGDVPEDYRVGRNWFADYKGNFVLRGIPNRGQAMLVATYNDARGESQVFDLASYRGEKLTVKVRESSGATPLAPLRVEPSYSASGGSHSLDADFYAQTVARTVPARPEHLEYEFMPVPAAGGATGPQPTRYDVSLEGPASDGTWGLLLTMHFEDEDELEAPLAEGEEVVEEDLGDEELQEALENGVERLPPWLQGRVRSLKEALQRLRERNLSRAEKREKVAEQLQILKANRRLLTMRARLDPRHASKIKRLFVDGVRMYLIDGPTGMDD